MFCFFILIFKGRAITNIDIYFPFKDCVLIPSSDPVEAFK